MRCMHEASLYEDNSFITLTYSDEFLPDDRSLDYSDFQKFMKRLRFAAGSNGVRFFMCGEYGPETRRPHFHACLFNCSFRDRRFLFKSGGGQTVYESDALSSLWPYGFASVGDVTFESAAYVARYCVSKITGDAAIEHYQYETGSGTVRLEPEFAHMSLKPGIGARFFDKFKEDIYPHDYVIVNGVKSCPPKYYDELFTRFDPLAMEDIKADRWALAKSRSADNTPERLAVKEIVQRRRSDMLIRGDIL